MLLDICRRFVKLYRTSCCDICFQLCWCWRDSCILACSGPKETSCRALLELSLARCVLYRALSWTLPVLLSQELASCFERLSPVQPLRPKRTLPAHSASKMFAPASMTSRWKRKVFALPRFRLRSQPGEHRLSESFCRSWSRPKA